MELSWDEAQEYCKSMGGHLAVISTEKEQKLVESVLPASNIVKYNGNYYCAINKRLTWKKAKRYCEKLGGHLVTVTSNGEKKLVESIAKDRGQYWLGATDEANEGQWKWVTGERWNYADWASGQPDDEHSFSSGYVEEGENYLVYNRNLNGWNDTVNDTSIWDNTVDECSTGLICEWDGEIIEKPRAQTVLGKTSYTKNIGAKAFSLDCSAKTPLTYVSDGLGVATVDRYGTVKIKGVGKAKITVKAKGTTQYKKAVKKIIVIVNPRSTFIRTIRRFGSKLTITWKKQQTQTTGYIVQYSLKKNFKKVTTKKIASNKIAKVSFGKLKRKMKYYVRIRTYKTVKGKNYYSSWSKVRSVKTK